MARPPVEDGGRRSCRDTDQAVDRPPQQLAAAACYRRRMPASKRSRYPQSEKLFAAASRILPGGVDSPVRAFKSVGATPLFIERGRGAYIEDADGHTYIDYVMSWGRSFTGMRPGASSSHWPRPQH